MRDFIASACALLLLIPSGWAQTATDDNEGTRVTVLGPAGAFKLSWWGRAGRTYLIQQSDDLDQWNYVPIIEVGQDQVIEWGFTSTAEKMFFRLTYADEDDPNSGDINGNDLPDIWELEQFGAFEQSPSADPDHDGRSNLTEFLIGTDPNTPHGEIEPQFAVTGLKVFTRLE